MKHIPHSAMKIFVWVLLVLMAQRLQPIALLVMCGVVSGAAIALSADKLLVLVRRTRWIMASLLFIYAYTIPGKAFLPFLGLFSPTYEGLLDGVLQLGRILTVLSSLAVLLELLTSEQLISGLYTWAYPLRYFGLSRERIAVRLALTLQYAENAMSETARDWRSTIADSLNPEAEAGTHVALELQPIGTLDVFLMVAIVAVLIGVW